MNEVLGNGYIANFLVQKGPNKKLNQNFLGICTSTPHIHDNNKVSRNSAERFLRSYADKNRIKGLTDGRVKNIIPSAPRCVAYKYDDIEEIRAYVKTNTSKSLMQIYQFPTHFTTATMVNNWFCLTSK